MEYKFRPYFRRRQAFKRLVGKKFFFLGLVIFVATSILKVKLTRLVVNDTILLPAEEELISLIMTGDVSLGRAVNAQIQRSKNPYLPFEKTASFLKGGDLTIVNLESPLLENCPLTSEGMKLCGSLVNIAGLSFAGIDIASVANNHINDFGSLGAQKTEEILSENGIRALKNEELLVYSIKGVNFAFLAYDLIGHQFNQEKFLKQITKAKEGADLLVIIFHWGVEYTAKPTERQKQIAYLAIDQGADLILGNHPHWVQSREVYKDKLIVYSHGNFVFDQLWSEKTRQGIIGKYTFQKKKLIDSRFLPIWINESFQPELKEY